MTPLLNGSWRGGMV